MRSVIRESLAGLRHRNLWLVQFFGNAVLFAAAAAWLLVPEERVWQLLLAFVGGAAVVFLFLWLHAGTFVALPEGDLRPAFRKALRRVLVFLPWAISFGALLWFVDSWSGESWRISGYIDSRLSSRTREALGWSFTHNLVSFCFFVLFWYVVPGIMLPFGMAAARGMGRRGVANALRTLRRLAYWAWLAVLVAVGVYVPMRLMEWTPGSTLTSETISLIVRMLVAYVLAIGCWLIVVAMLGSLSTPSSEAGGDARS
ncbi:MAG TPA: hypothetical protein VD837_03920 [Terriglobales bacterium]|nr:hypothetical protein [Terriglobales bacterium]